MNISQQRVLFVGTKTHFLDIGCVQGKEYLEKQGYTVSSIKPLITTRTVGQQMNEYEETVFTGIEAKIKVEPITTNSDNKPHYKD